MCNVSIAKDRMATLTLKLEKDLYVLRYGDKDYIKLTDEVYHKLKNLCEDDSRNTLSFPLKKIGNEIYLDESNENLYKALHILAEEFDIILNHLKIKKTY